MRPLGMVDKGGVSTGARLQIGSRYAAKVSSPAVCSALLHSIRMRSRCTSVLQHRIMPLPGKKRTPSACERGGPARLFCSATGHRDNHEVTRLDHGGDRLRHGGRGIDQQHAIAGLTGRCDGGRLSVRARVDPGRRDGLARIPSSCRPALRVRVDQRHGSDAGRFGRHGQPGDRGGRHWQRNRAHRAMHNVTAL